MYVPSADHIVLELLSLAEGLRACGVGTAARQTLLVPAHLPLHSHNNDICTQRAHGTAVASERYGTVAV